jgi:putative membrane protein insertion efficiency factor
MITIINTGQNQFVFQPWFSAVKCRLIDFMSWLKTGIFESYFHQVKNLRKLISYILIGLVKFYQGAISPLLPSSCRYTPSCSQYMIDALRIHGPFKGLNMGLKRISRCHPWGGSGWDPVPPKEHDHDGK